MRIERRWLVVVVYAIAMAWLESAVVFYLRTWSDRIEPYHIEPLPMIAGLGAVEVVREAATMVMLFTVGVLAGKTWRKRWAYAALAFGVWDIFYYVFLKMICGWPHSLKDWDILFLLPLPWWGPVISPILIALLMITWGTFATQLPPDTSRSTRSVCIPWLLSFCGMFLALFVFMEDSIHAVRYHTVSIRMLLPNRFDWPLFTLALVLMSAPILPYINRFWRIGNKARHNCLDNEALNQS